MHFILTFLSSNTRIEIQTFGSTTRQRKRDSNQYIIIKIINKDTIEKIIDEGKKLKNFEENF